MSTKLLDEKQKQQFLEYLKELYAHQRAYHDSKEMMAWLLTAANIGFAGIIGASVVAKNAPLSIEEQLFAFLPLIVCWIFCQALISIQQRARAVASARVAAASQVYLEVVAGCQSLTIDEIKPTNEAKGYNFCPPVCIHRLEEKCKSPHTRCLVPVFDGADLS